MLLVNSVPLSQVSVCTVGDSMPGPMGGADGPTRNTCGAVRSGDATGGVEAADGICCVCEGRPNTTGTCFGSTATICADCALSCANANAVERACCDTPDCSGGLLTLVAQVTLVVSKGIS